MRMIIAFLIGLLVGAFFGILITAMLVANRDEDEL